MSENVVSIGSLSLHLNASTSFLPLREVNHVLSSESQDLDGIWATNTSDCFQTLRFEKVLCSLSFLSFLTFGQGLIEEHRTGAACGNAVGVYIGSFTINAQKTQASVKFSYIRGLVDGITRPTSVR